MLEKTDSLTKHIIFRLNAHSAFHCPHYVTGKSERNYSAFGSAELSDAKLTACKSLWNWVEFTSGLEYGSFLNTHRNNSLHSRE